MVNDHLYNIMEQCVQELKSLQRIKNNYPSDAGDCESCSNFWDKMKTDKEDHVKELLAMLKDHLA